MKLSGSPTVVRRTVEFLTGSSQANTTQMNFARLGTGSGAAMSAPEIYDNGVESLFFEISSKYGERIPPDGNGGGLTICTAA